MDTTGFPATNPANTTIPSPADNTACPRTPARSTPRCPGSQSCSGLSNTRTTAGRGTSGQPYAPTGTSWSAGAPRLGAAKPTTHSAARPTTHGAAASTRVNPVGIVVCTGVATFVRAPITVDGQAATGSGARQAARILLPAFGSLLRPAAGIVLCAVARSVRRDVLGRAAGGGSVVLRERGGGSGRWVSRGMGSGCALGFAGGIACAASVDDTTVVNRAEASRGSLRMPLGRDGGRLR